MKASSYSFLTDVLGCSTIDGCAPSDHLERRESIEKLHSSMTQNEASTNSFAVGEEVTCMHNDLPEWYHAKVVAVGNAGDIDVEYMDGEVETKNVEDVFRGNLSMEQVRVGLKVRDGCHDLRSGVTFPTTLQLESEASDEFALAGCIGTSDQLCVGLFLNKAHLPRFQSKFEGVAPRQMSQSEDFISLLKSEDVSKLVMIEFCTRVNLKDVVGVFGNAQHSQEFTAKLSKFFPKAVNSGSTLSIAYSSKDVKIALNADKTSKENMRVLSLTQEGLEGDVENVVGILEKVSDDGNSPLPGLLKRVPKLLRTSTA